MSSSVGQSSDEITCPFCKTEGLSWLEYHLTGARPCPQAPPNVTQIFQFGNQEKVTTTTTASRSRKRRQQESASNGNGMEHLEGTTAGTEQLIEAKKSICNFFYENGIDFDVVKSPSFRKMASLVFGPNVQLPASDKLQEWILEDQSKEINKYVNEIRSSWAEMGSSILIDGWANADGRNFISIFVDSWKGTIYLRSFDVSDIHGDSESMKLLFEQVIAEVGINNVVQIITYSTSGFMKEIGKQLMEKYRSIFWTVDASCCIDLMIEKYGAIVSETLEKAKVITRFVYNDPQAKKYVQDHAKKGELLVRSNTKLAFSFFTLENIVTEENVLKALFLSGAFVTSTAESKRVADLVGDKSFWDNATTVLTATIPLVRIMELMNKEKSHMGCIYETMDQVKETIEKGFENEKSQYMQFWNVIDEIWCDHLYSSLHSFGYFLNPIIFYSEDVCIDKEVSVGLLRCVTRMAENLRAVDLITAQLDVYQMHDLSQGSENDNRSDISPVEWWFKYGGELPELQKYAIRTLSQTCIGASRLQLKRSLAENLFQGRRNQIEQERLSETVFMLYNMQLSRFASGPSDCMVSNEIELVNDWTVNEAHG